MDATTDIHICKQQTVNKWNTYAHTCLFKFMYTQVQIIQNLKREL